MKKMLAILPLFLLVSCGNLDDSNKSASIEESTSTTHVSVTPVSESSKSVDSEESLSSGHIDDLFTYNVRGHFKDNKDNPIENITVGLYDSEKVYLNSDITDGNGEFSFDKLLEGKYYLSILKIESDKYKNVNDEWSFEVKGEAHDLQIDEIVLEIDNIKWSDLM